MTTAISEHSLPAEKLAHREWAWWLLLGVSVSLLWCTAYNRWTAEAWSTPIAYSSDALAVMANAKAFSSGDIWPIVLKYPPSLGAPFVANWNDYPTPAEGLFFWSGILVRLFGIFTGSNLTVLSAHLLAAGSFYFVARILGYRRALCVAGAIVFSMSRYAFARNLVHLGPLFYWHVPLGLLVVWWTGGFPSILQDPRKILFCAGVAIVHGIQDPYFSGIFLQFLVFAAAVCLIRRDPWRKVMFPLFIAAIVLATCVVMNVDTFHNRWVNGPNPEALVRNYVGLELYALKPVELFLPVTHRITALQNWVQSAYVARVMVRGEMQSPYLGVIGIAALGVLIWATVRATIHRTVDGVPSHSWLVLWIVLYSVVGGVNGFLGVFGVVLFRGTNRYSIVILALVLLFLVRQLTILTRKWNWLAVSSLAGLIAAVGFFDQSPRPTDARAIAQTRDQVASDRQIVSSMEAKLPARAMVFELPIWNFPETPPLLGMQDYEHFRPYLQSRSLRFSYGNVKGRTRERWQKEAEQLGPSYLVTTLEKYGFSSILINKKAYHDRAASLLSEFSSAGRSEILAQSSDLVCLSLHPSTHPTLPPEFDGQWYPLEGDAKENWRWSQRDATIVLHNSHTVPQRVHLSFSLGVLKARRVEISSGSTKLYADRLSPDLPPQPVDFTINLAPGRNEIVFRSDSPAETPRNGDTRKLAFNVRNFTILE